MPPPSLNREFAFMLNDVARLLRTYADYKASQFGMTRAQWAVLVRVDRSEGLNQSELAEVLDLQPITLTRLLDKLCDSGLIERRPDPTDRRAKRLFLTAAARPLLERLSILGEETVGGALAGVERESVEQMVSELGMVKENLRRLNSAARHRRCSGRATLWLKLSANLYRTTKRPKRRDRPSRRSLPATSAPSSGPSRRTKCADCGVANGFVGGCSRCFR